MSSTVGLVPLVQRGLILTGPMECIYATRRRCRCRRRRRRQCFVIPRYREISGSNGRGGRGQLIEKVDCEYVCMLYVCMYVCSGEVLGRRSRSREEQEETADVEMEREKVRERK